MQRHSHRTSRLQGMILRATASLADEEGWANSHQVALAVAKDYAAAARLPGKEGYHLTETGQALLGANNRLFIRAASGPEGAGVVERVRGFKLSASFSVSFSRALKLLVDRGLVEREKRRMPEISVKRAAGDSRGLRLAHEVEKERWALRVATNE